jgi:GAF domain-containing protein/HAMP domain-containing protein
VPPVAPVAATNGSQTVDGTRPRRSLVRKYALLFIALVGVTLIVNSALDFWFSYKENQAALIRVQQEKADAAAQRIEEFVEEIESQIGWTTHAQWAAGSLDQRRFDYVRLLRQVPAITELSQLDGEGKEQLKVSRLAMDAVGSGEDFSFAPAFTQAKAHGTWFSPVYFRKESEPYITLAMARAGKNAGVTVAEINLKLIWDVVTALKIGQGGYAYVVDQHGRLIAHPDISLVLRDTDLSKLPQVAATLAPASGSPTALAPVTVAKSIGGRSVLTAHAAISPLGWLVFVEVPLEEAFAPLYGAAWRTGLVLLLGLLAAALAALVLARRMTGPIRALQAGAARIGAGELDRRIDIHTGDELEGLADQFNSMAADLHKSYAELEQKVEERTAELSEALDQQTATAEVLQVINSSPGDLAPVFDAMLEKAMRLCSVAFGSLQTYDGEEFRAVATRGLPSAFADRLRQGYRPDPAQPVSRLLSGDRFVQIPDLAESDTPQRAFEMGGMRTLLSVPLLREERVIGIINLARDRVEPFSDKQVALVQNFAAQAVIAIENVRLLGEIQQRQAELRVTFDNMADGVVMFDQELRLAAWNRNFQELVKLPDDFLAEPHNFADYIRYLAKRGEFGDVDPEAELARLSGQFADHYSFNRTRPDGTIIEVRHNPMPEGGFVLIYSDVTERTRSEAEIRAARDAAETALRELKTAQASLIQAEKMASLGQLTAGIAHEIKNPLNFVNNFASLSVELLDELKETAAPAIAALSADKRAEVDETVELLDRQLGKDLGARQTRRQHRQEHVGALTRGEWRAP